MDGFTTTAVTAVCTQPALSTTPSAAPASRSPPPSRGSYPSWRSLRELPPFWGFALYEVQGGAAGVKETRTDAAWRGAAYLPRTSCISRISANHAHGSTPRRTRTLPLHLPRQPRARHNADLRRAQVEVQARVVVLAFLVLGHGRLRTSEPLRPSSTKRTSAGGFVRSFFSLDDGFSSPQVK